MRFKALSLIDITKTGVSRNKEAEDQKAVAQFANYMTDENCLQLRSNIKILAGPKCKKIKKQPKIDLLTQHKTTQLCGKVNR